jgi:hypothetical protein
MQHNEYDISYGKIAYAAHMLRLSGWSHEESMRQWDREGINVREAFIEGAIAVRDAQTAAVLV